MKWAVIGLCLLGSIAAACAALLVNTLRVQAAGTMMSEGSGEVSVLYAKQSMPAMTVLESGMVVPKTMLKSQAPQKYISNPADVVGKVLSRPIDEGQPFMTAMFTDAGGAHAVAAVIPNGKRAVGISVTNYAGLEGLLYPGSVVDVMVSLKSGDGNDGSRRDAFTATLLENVQVLAIERDTVVSPTRTAIPGEAAPRSSDTHTVTLLVDSKQAKALELAMEQGTLSLALRNPLDSASTDREAVSLQSLLGHHVRTVAPEAPAAPVPATRPAEPQWETTVLRAGSVQTQAFPLSQQGAKPATK